MKESFEDKKNELFKSIKTKHLKQYLKESKQQLKELNSIKVRNLVSRLENSSCYIKKVSITFNNCTGSLEDHINTLELMILEYEKEIKRREAENDKSL